MGWRDSCCGGNDGWRSCWAEFWNGEYEGVVELRGECRTSSLLLSLIAFQNPTDAPFLCFGSLQYFIRLKVRLRPPLVSSPRRVVADLSSFFHARSNSSLSREH